MEIWVLAFSRTHMQIPQGSGFQEEITEFCKQSLRSQPPLVLQANLGVPALRNSCPPTSGTLAQLNRRKAQFTDHPPICSHSLLQKPFLPKSVELLLMGNN